MTSGGGNIPDGLNGNLDGDPFNVVETAAYLTYNGFEAWPITVYGTFARNLDAESSVLFPGAGKEDTAWGVGVEVGDSKEFVKLGAGYWSIQANSFPSMFIDSDFLDGRTNRQGWAFYGGKEILRNTELKLTLFVDRTDPDRDRLRAVGRELQPASPAVGHRLQVLGGSQSPSALLPGRGHLFPRVTAAFFSGDAG